MTNRLLPFVDAYVLEPKRFNDTRGWFAVTWGDAAFKDQTGVETSFVQDNMSRSGKAGTVRGLHYQRAPFAQGKLVRCSRGALFDAIVDIRVGSPTYGRWGGVTLTEDNLKQLWVPRGFAHGFATLTDDTEIAYKVDGQYAPDHEGTICWNDPDLGIDWPFDVSTALLKDEDRDAPALKDAQHGFVWSG